MEGGPLGPEPCEWCLLQPRCNRRAASTLEREPAWAGVGPSSPVQAEGRESLLAEGRQASLEEAGGAFSYHSTVLVGGEVRPSYRGRLLCPAKVPELFEDA